MVYKIMIVTDSKRPNVHTDDKDKYDSAFFIQLGGETEYDPNEVEFVDIEGRKMSCGQIIDSLNASNPDN
jgi:hypothetical protein